MKKIKLAILILGFILSIQGICNKMLETSAASSGETTSITICYKSSGTDEIIKTEIITDLVIGSTFVYEPISELAIDEGGVYGCDYENIKNILTIESLSANPDDNIVVVYYKEIDGRHKAATIYIKDADTDETIKEIKYWFRGNPPIYSPMDSFAKRLESYTYWEGESFTYDPIDSFVTDDQVTYIYDRDNGKNSLTIKLLKWDYAQNTIKAYYKKLQKEDISRATVTIDPMVYSGKRQVPDIMVKCNGKELISNKDYLVACKNNKNVGKATATITGIGNYSGTKSVNFNILPKANKIKKITNIKGRKLVVKISKSKGARGYHISYATNRKFTSAKKRRTTGTSVTLKGLKKNRTYYVRVRAYAKINGKIVYSSYSAIEKMKIEK